MGLINIFNNIRKNFRYNMIVPSNSRYLEKDVELGGYLIEKGTMVNFGVAYITKSERFFKNPSKFDPDRFRPENQGSEKIDPYSLLHFGFGSRMCIGRRLAEQEIYLTLIKLIQNFKIEYVGKTPEVKTGLLLTPSEPLDLKLTLR